VFTTCIFCHKSLGTNEVVDHFPVGRRLAFDSVKGRPWVVCSHCQRWSLTPLEERWEAVEECERLFSGRALRAQTEHIGLTKLPDGLDLIRIGAPLKPEFAAWRYGDVFRRRFRRRVTLIGGGIVTAGAGLAIGLTTGVDPSILTVGAPAAGIVGWLANFVIAYRNYLQTTYIPRGAAPISRVRCEHQGDRSGTETGRCAVVAQSATCLGHRPARRRPGKARRRGIDGARERSGRIGANR